MFILAIVLFVVGMALLIDRGKWSKAVGLAFLLASLIALMAENNK